MRSQTLHANEVQETNHRCGHHRSNSGATHSLCWPTGFPHPGSDPLHIASIPYYSIKGDWDSVLTLNNSAHGPLTASITLYALDGTPLPLPDVELQAHGLAGLRLSESIRSSSVAIERFAEGSIELRFNSQDGMALAPQLTVADRNQGLSFDSEPAMGLKSSTLEGLWWSEDEKTSGQVALSNTTADNLNVQVGIEWHSIVIPSSPISLVKHQTVVLDIAQLLRDLHIASKRIEKGGLTISHNGAPGALIAQGVVFNKEKRRASNLNFSDPAGVKNNVLNGSGLMLGHPAAGSGFAEGAFFVPRLTLKNASKVPQTAAVTVSYTANGRARDKALPRISIASHEVRSVDFTPIVTGLGQMSVSGAGLKIEATGGAGTLVAALSSVDASGHTVVDVPLVSRSERSGEGGNHPFRLNETSQSVAYLTNITQRPTKVMVAIFHSGGMFTPELMAVGPGQTVAIDILKLRDSQVKDVQGRTLPPDLSEGQIFWKPHQLEALVGRVVTLDKLSRTSSSFGCPNCCVYEPGGWESAPEPFTGPPGSSLQMTLYEYDSLCGCCTMGPYVASTVRYVNSSNTSVATVNSSGMVTFGNAGNANIVWGVEYYHSDFISAEDCGLMAVETEVLCPVQSKPTVTSLNVSMPSTKNIVNSQRPNADTVSDTNTDLAFATTSTTNLMALFQNSMVQTSVTANTALSAKVNYTTSGLWTETTGTGGAVPMVDTGNVTAGQEPTGGDTPFRTQSMMTSSNNSGNGKVVIVISDDNPGFGPWKITHPSTSNTWASTQGGYDFREFIVGFSSSFPKYYVAFAQGDWTLRVTGNNSGGNWMNNQSAVTLQGSSMRPQGLTDLITSGSPPSAEAAGVQVRGRSYSTNHGSSYTP
jgi:hypothetical protein